METPEGLKRLFENSNIVRNRIYKKAISWLLSDRLEIEDLDTISSEYPLINYIFENKPVLAFELDRADKIEDHVINFFKGKGYVVSLISSANGVYTYSFRKESRRYRDNSDFSRMFKTMKLK